MRNPHTSAENGLVLIPRYPVRPELGFVTQIGHWRFVIHYTDCGMYLRSHERNRSLPVSPGMRLAVCKLCRPSEEEIAPFLKTVAINVYHHGSFVRVAQPEIGA